MRCKGTAALATNAKGEDEDDEEDENEEDDDVASYAAALHDIMRRQLQH